MNLARFSIDARDPSKDRAFRRQEFRRILALAWPYRVTIAFGLLCTVLFASLHTLSLGGAYPVFKILLEREGLEGWVDRTIASKRLGVDFATPTAEGMVRVVRVRESSPAYAKGLREEDVIADPGGRPVRELFHDLAYAEPEKEVQIHVLAAVPGGQGERRDLYVQPGPLDWKLSLLHWSASFIPADAESDAGKLRTLGYLLVALVVVVLLANVFRYFGEILIARAILRAMMGVRARLYERTLRLPMAVFSGQPSADLVTRFVQDVQEIQRGMLTLFGKFIREPLRAVFILGLAFTFDWRITLMMVVVTPIAILVFLLVGRSVKKANRKLLQLYGRMIDALTTTMHNLRVVKAYTAEEHERIRLRAIDWRMFRQQLKLVKLQAFISPMMEALAVMAGSIVTVWLAGRVLQHDLEVSKFVALGVILSMLFDPLRKLTDVYVRVQRSTAGAERIFQVIDHPVEGGTPEPDLELKPLAESIEYVNVTFTYPGAEQPALKDVNLSIRQGETVAIVGPNGCGKTTLVSMLPRFFDPDSGEVRFDGVDVRRAFLKSLRSQISLVSQEAIVFAGTPTENIAYGLASPDEKGVEHAAGRAFADEFIRNLPGAYASNLGERGTTLSGGQRQRLAIARAIFRDAPILIFDEATSQVDTESEQKIQNALKEFSKGRTTLIIAHRLSTIQFANRIIVMDAGQVIDSGAHKELFERCRVYRNLCETQFVTESD